KYVNCDADAIVAWSTGLRVQMQAQTHSSGVWRRRGNTGEGWELSFMGTGYALVQPSELLPPQNAQIGSGLAAQCGMGKQGAGGQNEDNVWSWAGRLSSEGRTPRRSPLTRPGTACVVPSQPGARRLQQAHHGLVRDAGHRGVGE